LQAYCQNLARSKHYKETGGYNPTKTARGKKMDKKKRIGCRSCSHYSGSLGRCRLGKINPRTVKDAKSAAKLMGINYICNMNGIKDNMMNDGIRTWRKTMGV